MTRLLSLSLFVAYQTASPLAAIEEIDPARSALPPYPEFGVVERLSPQLDALLAPDARMEALATGFDWSEGPVWDPQSNRLYFSDIPRNTVYQWSEANGVSIFLTPSGFTGQSYQGREPGSNGLALDRNGQLLLCQHGDRRVARLNPNRWGFTTLASEWQGKRLNSPNDLCLDAEGNLYFTDPPYGLGPDAPKELDFHGVYRLDRSGTLSLLTDELERPNGIALSPDGTQLYVANSHGPRPIIMRYRIDDDGRLAEGEVFFDATPLRERGLRGNNDGLKTDRLGNVWATTAGGVAVISQQGELLGLLLTGRFTANCAFGGPDGSTLYITADDTLCRIETRVQGYAPFLAD